ncbi:MAG: hypothetical protein A2138_15960 [Deltaproteobacteria bacterium RBG_16_71_12]|nr:MAG: hypothetical protein A2138_15960 [Deltaproteobacteria bacterium RBG_16_71_12]
MRALSWLLSSMLLVSVLASCGTGKGGKMQDAPAAPPQPPSAPGSSDIAKGSDAVSVEIRKAVSEQMGCPLEQLNIICTERDRSGECISVRALGCDKELELKFGND